jgi:hypothetical protein
MTNQTLHLTAICEDGGFKVIRIPINDNVVGILDYGLKYEC